MSIHTKTLTVTRLLVAALMLVAIWTSPGILAGICASLGTLIWVFLANFVALEEKIIKRILK